MSILDDNIHLALEKIAKKSDSQKVRERLALIAAGSGAGGFTGGLAGANIARSDSLREAAKATSIKAFEAAMARGNRRALPGGAIGGAAGALLGAGITSALLLKKKKKEKTASAARDLAKKYKDKKR
tara:strand:- start:959 stop:1339 length:381 start_codon:yes stop_codon:yes gene_type:complete